MNKRLARLVSLIAVAVLLTVTTAVYGRYGFAQQPNFTVLSKAVTATGATVQRAEINAWVRLEDAADDDALLEDRVRNSFNYLGYDGNTVVIEKQHNRYFSRCRGEIRSTELDLVVISQVLYPRANQKPEAYTVINAVLTSPVVNPTVIERKISETLTDLGPQPRINTCLVGQLDGKLNKNDFKECLALAFDRVHAVVVDQMIDDDLASITGYTRGLANFFRVKQEKVNINMAMRYSPSEGKTYVTIGSPVITREY